MAITPLDIEKQEFSNSFFGFSKVEVETYLYQVAQEFHRIIKENTDLKSKIEILSFDIEKYKKIENNLQITLLNAQENTQKIQNDAKIASEQVLADAISNAEKIQKEAEENAKNIRNSVHDLQESKNRLISELRSIITTQELLLARKGFSTEFKTLTNPENE